MNTNEGYPTAPNPPPQYTYPQPPQPPPQYTYPPQPPQYTYPQQPPNQLQYQQRQHPPVQHVMYVNPQELSQENHTDISPVLYCSCCALFFIPFGWIFAIVALCWFQRLKRPKTKSEMTAYKALQICMIINIIFTIIVIIYT